MEQIEIPKKNIYALAIINGLASTISLWLFWTPFIIFIARPLINAQIKDQICEYSFRSIFNLKEEWNNYIQNLLTKLVVTNQITPQQYQDLLEKLIWSSETRPSDLQAKLDNNVNVNWAENLPLIITFFIVFLIVIWICLFFIMSLCGLYGIDFNEVLYFNLVMTAVIVTIETVFFAAVAMRYIPYDLKLILDTVETDILSIF
jgi:hypothetical protein